MSPARRSMPAGKVPSNGSPRGRGHGRRSHADPRQASADDCDPRHPALEPARRPDLQEAREVTDDLDLVAAIQPADLRGPEVVGPVGQPDEPIADRSPVNALPRRRLEPFRLARIGRCLAVAPLALFAKRRAQPAGQICLIRASAVACASPRENRRGGRGRQEARSDRLPAARRPAEDEQEEQHAERGGQRPHDHGKSRSPGSSPNSQHRHGHRRLRSRRSNAADAAARSRRPAPPPPGPPTATWPGVDAVGVGSVEPVVALARRVRCRQSDWGLSRDGSRRWGRFRDWFRRGPRRWLRRGFGRRLRRRFGSRLRGWRDDHDLAWRHLLQDRPSGYRLRCRSSPRNGSPMSPPAASSTSRRSLRPRSPSRNPSARIARDRG